MILMNPVCEDLKKDLISKYKMVEKFTKWTTLKQTGTIPKRHTKRLIEYEIDKYTRDYRYREEVRGKV